MTKNIAFGIIIGLLFISLVVLFCAILIKLYIQKIKKYNAVIYENEIQFQKTLMASVIETQEQLLTSISQDLHDDAGQQLTIINFQLENLKLDHPNCKNDLDPISESVAGLSHSLRQISHSLNNNWIVSNGLLKAIRQETERIRKKTSVEVTLEIDNDQKSFQIDTQIVIFRIFQETVNNTLKHAKASKIEIHISTKPFFKISIHDNGIGFESDKIHEKKSSIGIPNCTNRAKMIGHHFEIKSTPGTGTTVILQENL